MKKFLILAVLLMTSFAASAQSYYHRGGQTATVSTYPVYQRVYEHGSNCQQVQVERPRSQTFEIVANAAIDEVLINVDPRFRPAAAAGVRDMNARRLATQTGYAYQTQCSEGTGYYREVLVGYRKSYRFPDGRTEEKFEPVATP